MHANQWGEFEYWSRPIYHLFQYFQITANIRQIERINNKWIGWIYSQAETCTQLNLESLA